MVEHWSNVGIIKGIDFTGYYKVSNKGRIKSIKRFNHKVNRYYGGKILTPIEVKKRPNYNNYMVNLSKDGKHISVWVHKVVALTFIPNPDNKPEINHKDSNTKNNWADNLEWCIHRENVEHAMKYGNVGHKVSYNAKEVISDYINGEKVSYICEKHKISKSILSVIRKIHKIPPRKTNTLSRKILCTNNNLEFDSLHSCARWLVEQGHTKAKSTSVWKVANKQRNHYKGYNFEYFKKKEEK